MCAIGQQKERKEMRRGVILKCSYVIITANELPWPGLLWADGGHILIGQAYYIHLLQAKARKGNSLQLLGHRSVQLPVFGPRERKE